MQSLVQRGSLLHRKLKLCPPQNRKKEQKEIRAACQQGYPHEIPSRNSAHSRFKVNNCLGYQQQHEVEKLPTRYLVPKDMSASYTTGTNHLIDVDSKIRSLPFGRHGSHNGHALANTVGLAEQTIIIYFL